MRVIQFWICPPYLKNTDTLLPYVMQNCFVWSNVQYTLYYVHYCFLHEVGDYSAPWISSKPQHFMYKRCLQVYRYWPIALRAFGPCLCNPPLHLDLVRIGTWHAPSSRSGCGNPQDLGRDCWLVTCQEWWTGTYSGAKASRIAGKASASATRLYAGWLSAQASLKIRMIQPKFDVAIETISFMTLWKWDGCHQHDV